MTILISMEYLPPDPTVFYLTLIQLIYGIPLFIIMMIVCGFLAINKQFKGPFYRLVIFILFMNSLCYLNRWPAVRLERFSATVGILKTMESTVSGSLRFMEALACFFMHFQFIMAIVLSLQRFLISATKVPPAQFWRKFFWSLSCFSVVYALFMSFVVLFKFHDKFLIESGVLFRIENPENNTEMTKLIGGISFGVFLVITSFASGAVWRVWNSKSKSSINHKNTKNLTIIVVSYLFCHCFLLIWYTLKAIDVTFQPFLPLSFRRLNTLIEALFSDLITLSLPLLLLFFDATLRRIVFENKVSTVLTVSAID